jgi:tRNA(Ile)-lysidine synthase
VAVAVSHPGIDAGAAGDQPVSDDAFAVLMAAVGPFESQPRLVVAVSGGADSMALCLLADRWARARGGRITALTVDHGLRPNAAREARQVGRWLTAKGIEHHVLRWRGPKPASGIQAAARAARYELLTSWLRRAGILHLLLAHHQEDQAETFLLRLERGSGPDGLAAMAAVVETPAVRLVRPLLAISRDSLRATLRALGQAWVEDPSNQDTAFLRVRVRGTLPAFRDLGWSAGQLAAETRNLAECRVVVEAKTVRRLARCCMLHPAGYAWVDGAALAEDPEDVSIRALARILLCIGGRSYTPRRDKLERLHRWLSEERLSGARTLGGCRIVPQTGRILVCREGRNVPGAMAVVPGHRFVWDARFAIEFVKTAGAVNGLAHLVRLGRDGWADVVRDSPGLRRCQMPAPARFVLPALRDDYGVFSVPHLYYRRMDPAAPGVDIGNVVFCPVNTLSGAGFFLA